MVLAQEDKGVLRMSLQEVSTSVRFSELELGVLARWQRERTFERSLARRRGAPRFVFYDGPPFATGLPHYGHILTSFIKDVVPRYQTMRGFDVPRRWGWDCHGVGPFNATCRELVARYAGEWETAVTRLGRWVDFEAAYRTMDADYIESVVWCFHALHERGLAGSRSRATHRSPSRNGASTTSPPFGATRTTASATRST
jgi:isoleucyl-tRNA synthetase